MKGFPRRGSDRVSVARRRWHIIRLNEGLPQKGKRSVVPAPAARVSSVPQ